MIIRGNSTTITELGRSKFQECKKSEIEVKGNGQLEITGGRGPSKAATQVETSTTETIEVAGSTTAIVQTASAITTSVSGAVAGSIVILINDSDGRNEIGFQIDDDTSPYILPNEGFQLYFDGSNWSMI